MSPVTVGAMVITGMSLLIFAGLIVAGVLAASSRREW
jgi:hypothetical protein